MYGTMDPELPTGMTMQEYRERFQQRREEFFRTVTKENFKEITDVIMIPPSVDMKEIRGTNQEVAAAVDRFYANDGR